MNIYKDKLLIRQTYFWCDIGYVSSSSELCGWQPGNINDWSSSTPQHMYGCGMYLIAYTDEWVASVTPKTRWSVKCNHLSSMTFWNAESKMYLYIPNCALQNLFLDLEIPFKLYILKCIQRYNVYKVSKISYGLCHPKTFGSPNLE